MMNIQNNFQDDIWTFLQHTDKAVILYGTGNGADKVLDRLLALGVTPYGIMASDDFVRGQSFRGYEVKKLSDLEQECDEMVILTCFGSPRPEVMANIFHIAERHLLLAPDVPVYGEHIFDSDFYTKHREQLEQVYEMLGDELSKKTFENVVRYKLTGNIDCLKSVFSEKEEVFEHLIRLSHKEDYLDLGAYRGDTIEEFLRHTDGEYRSITALEPDVKTYRKLKEYAGNMHDTQLYNMGIWNEDTDIAFENALGRGSSIKSSGTQKLAVTKIDTLYRRRTVSYIKIDVEGSEREALDGGKTVIARDKPMLNLAIYHRSEDIFALPLQLKNIQPKYQIFMRQHPHIPAWDLNLYAY